MEKRVLTINEIVENPLNKRTVTKAQFKSLKRSLKKYGLIDPLIVDNRNVLLSGHQRLKVLRQRGEREVEVLVATNGDLQDFNKVNDYGIDEVGVEFEKSRLYVNWRDGEIKTGDAKVIKPSSEAGGKVVSAYKLVGSGKISWDLYNSRFDKINDVEFWDKLLRYINENQ
jgi:hypothetical protein